MIWNRKVLGLMKRKLRARVLCSRVVARPKYRNCMARVSVLCILVRSVGRPFTLGRWWSKLNSRVTIIVRIRLILVGLMLLVLM